MESPVPQFDPALVARYEMAGPRYTSYPPASHFHAGFGEDDFRRIARMSNDDPIPRRLSLYVHIPFCLSPCFYCGCTRVITRDTKKSILYLERLYREIELVAPLFDRDRPVVQLHLGGGTPNFLDPGQMGELMDSLARHFSFSREAEREFGIEIDPRHCDAAYIQALAGYGFNRLSLGIQDFDPQVQQAVNRVQSVEQTRAVLEAARAAGFRSISVDLIYGLPKQTPEKFARTLDEVIALAPDRVACYAYAHLPERFKGQRQIVSSDLPDPATRLALLGSSVDRMTRAGYRYIGMDHFARPADDLARAYASKTMHRNFQGYSTYGDCEVIGLGMSAISHVGSGFSQNAKDLSAYYAALDAGRQPIWRGIELGDDDLIRADAIQRLMCQGEVNIAAFEAQHHLNFGDYFAAELAHLDALGRDGLVEISPERIGVTSRGRFLLRVIAMVFDAYLTPGQAQALRYSQVV